MAGQNLTYEVLVTNNGPSDAKVITVTDVLEIITATLRSTSTQDGWMLESGEITKEVHKKRRSELMEELKKIG